MLRSLRARRTLFLSIAGVLAAGAGCKTPGASRSLSGGDAGALLESPTSSAAPVADGGVAAESDSPDNDPLSEIASARLGPPSGTSDELRARVQHLLDAIAQGEPDLGRDILAPKKAYLALQTKHDAHHTYESDVVVPYRRRVRGLSKKRGLKDATVGSLSFGENISLVTLPPPKGGGAEANVVERSAEKPPAPMWRARRVRLTARGKSGSTTYAIAEMIAYEGAWYVLHL